MRSIYLIDDDMDDVELFRDALEEVAPSVSLRFANDAHEAVRNLAASAGALPDLVFLDISMPVLSGLQCLATLKKDDQLKGLPVIMYTTTSHEKEIRMARELGALAFITKPNDFRLLKRILAAVLDTPVERLSEELRKITDTGSGLQE
ncbi:MAG TPA: response regulator [Puia sp.]|nr:response regulator [Puia sp.]